MRKRTINHKARKTARRKNVVLYRANKARTPQELKEIALGIHRNSIFTNRHCYNQREVEMCFPLLRMMDAKMLRNTADLLGKRGLIFEDFHKAAPLGINGLPMFFSMRLLTSVQHTIVRERLDALREAEKEALA